MEHNILKIKEEDIVEEILYDYENYVLSKQTIRQILTDYKDRRKKR